MDNGFITLHRKITNNPIWQNPELAHLFTHLLVMANHERKRILRKGQEEWIERGQLKTGRSLLAFQTGIPAGSIHHYLMTLQNLKIVSIKSSSKYSIITIVKYSDYQSKKEKVSNKLATDKQHVSTNNNVNNENNETKYNLTVIPQATLHKLELIDYLKQQQNIKSLDSSEKWNKIYAGHLLAKMGNDPNRVKKYIDYALGDPFHKQNATSFKYLYNNLNKIALKAKGQSESHVKL